MEKVFLVQSHDRSCSQEPTHLPQERHISVSALRSESIFGAGACGQYVGQVSRARTYIEYV